MEYVVLCICESKSLFYKNAGLICILTILIMWNGEHYIIQHWIITFIILSAELLPVATSNRHFSQMLKIGSKWIRFICYLPSTRSNECSAIKYHFKMLNGRFAIIMEFRNSLPKSDGRKLIRSVCIPYRKFKDSREVCSLQLWAKHTWIVLNRTNSTCFLIHCFVAIDEVKFIVRFVSESIFRQFNFKHFLIRQKTVCSWLSYDLLFKTNRKEKWTLSRDKTGENSMHIRFEK